MSFNPFVKLFICCLSCRASVLSPRELTSAVYGSTLPRRRGHSEKLLSQGLCFMSPTFRAAFGCNLRAEAEGDAPGSRVTISTLAGSHQFELVLCNAECFFPTLSST